MATEPQHPAPAPASLLVQLAERQLHIKRNAYLFHMGDAVADRFYAIESGHWKCAVESPTGEHSIVALYSNGEHLGLAELHVERRTSFAKALSDSTLLEFSIARVLEAAQRDDALWEYLQTLLLRDISRQRNMAQFQRSGQAQQKVAAFLLAAANTALGPHHCGGHFHLPVSRADIAAYLGLADTTVSRELRQLTQAGCIKAKGRSLSIIDAAALRRAAGQ